MLRLCTAPGCRTIVLGRGTCVEHDAPRIAAQLTGISDRLLEEARQQTRTSGARPDPGEPG